ncbi:HLA class II histocompatibility antigen, DM beta chain [Oenanthe melanoleuca]|uniref:HLA class II histocompatibility antigen, DM beta chain n=1 Tax=Oenanthe melanoleuca TaxID=2939378 RepID=UPI0024C10E7A|nr:HLA class II histocompatibility antigen, DM beta chain [Oenanthe melanoleuca]
MLPLLLAALGAPGAAPFVLQVASWCSLATNGSLVATNDSQWLRVALSQQPLLCGDLRGPRARPCPGQGGPLVALGDNLARVLQRDPRWGRRLSQRLGVCRELPPRVWPPASAPPRLRIVPERSGPALTLTCHAWGFTPADVTLRWLRDGDAVGDGRAWPRPLPAGDGTFRAQVTIPVGPETGDTWECLALHPSLEEPVSVSWAPGMSPRLSLLVALAVLALGAGLLLLTLGLRRYLRPGSTFLPGRARAGYTPLPGDTYTGEI